MRSHVQPARPPGSTGSFDSSCPTIDTSGQSLQVLRVARVWVSRARSSDLTSLSRAVLTGVGHGHTRSVIARMGSIGPVHTAASRSCRASRPAPRDCGALVCRELDLRAVHPVLRRHLPARSSRPRGDRDVRDDDPRAAAGCSRVLRQQEALYGYLDTDPDHDCLGLCITPAEAAWELLPPLLERRTRSSSWGPRPLRRRCSILKPRRLCHPARP